MCVVCNACFEVWKCRNAMVMVTNVSRSPKVEVNCPINMSIVSQCRRCQGWNALFVVRMNGVIAVAEMKMMTFLYVLCVEMTWKRDLIIRFGIVNVMRWWIYDWQITQNLQSPSFNNQNCSNQTEPKWICGSGN